jgi:hypothetical protein
MAMSAMAKIIGNGITRQKATHELRKAIGAALQEDMRVIVEQRPGQNPGFGFLSDDPQPMDPISPVLVIIDDGAFFDPTDHHVVKRSRSIKSGQSGHNASAKMKLTILYHNNST